MVHIFGAVRLGRHVWCGRHSGMMKGKVESSSFQMGGGCNKESDFQIENRETRFLRYFYSITSLKLFSCRNRMRLSTGCGRIEAGKSEYQSDSYKGQLA